MFTNQRIISTWIIVVLFLVSCISGCATTYNSIRDTDSGGMELIADTESAVLSAASEAIRLKFPAAQIHQFSGNQTGFSWYHRPLLDRTNFKFLLKETKGVTNEGLEVVGYTYSIDTSGTQFFVNVSYVQPLIKKFKEVLLERGIQNVYIKKVIY